MSDTLFRLIPTDPNAVPDGPATDRTVIALRSLTPDAGRVEVEATDEVRFVDAGSNFDSIGCPACGAELDMEWWGEQMGQAFEGEFVDLALELPCCGGSSSLNDLVYDWPQGFARWTVSAWNPSRAPLDAAELGALSSAAGTPLRLVVCHI